VEETESMCMFRSGRVADSAAASATSLHIYFPSFEMVEKELTGGIAQEPSEGDRLADRIR
jgi:hypothetical protein